MASTLFRLAAVAIAAALALTGCALLPEGDAALPSAEPTSEPTPEPTPEVTTGRGECPREALEALLAISSDPVADPATVTEIDPGQFAPSSLAQYFDDACVYELSYIGRGGDHPITYQNAIVSGGDELFAAIHASLLSRGYENLTDPEADVDVDPEADPAVNDTDAETIPVSFREYRAPNGESVIVWTSESDGINWSTYNGPGFGFLGDEFIIVQSLDLSS